MRVETSITNDEVQVRLVPEGPIDIAVLDELSKVDAVVSVTRAENSAVLKKERGNRHFLSGVRKNGGEPCSR